LRFGRAYECHGKTVRTVYSWSQLTRSCRI
jgi:hypothetical protein